MKLLEHLSYVVVPADDVFSTLQGVKEVPPCEVKILQKRGFPINASDRSVKHFKNIINFVIFAH